MRAESTFITTAAIIIDNIAFYILKTGAANGQIFGIINAVIIIFFIQLCYSATDIREFGIFDDDAIGKSIFGRRNDIEGLIDIEIFKRAVDDFKAIINIHRIGAGADN